MISESTLRSIADIFCGNTGDYYSYKSGPQLVSFFNNHFNAKDQYQQGFPSRWAYVYDKLVELLNANRFDQFLSQILSSAYIMQDCGLTEVKAAERSQEVFQELNRIVASDLYIITHRNGRYHLCKKDEDLVLIGSGGFANVYRQKSTGLIVKKLKDEFLADKGIRSRFKREFDITKSLQDAHGIITVFTFDSAACSYTMEPAEQRLDHYLQLPGITDAIRINCIRQILYIMTVVHGRDIIHRDLSPNNIFIINGVLKIADFGLGKDLNVFTSHQTLMTNQVGQYYYCAPEQFMLLRDGDKRSDVYSLGRIINFVMTGHPTNAHHIFRSVAEKATNADAAYRYADANQLSTYFEKSVKYHQNAQNEQAVLQKIEARTMDDSIETFIYELTADRISKYICERQPGFTDALLKFMDIDDVHAQHIIQSVDRSYQDICGRSFEAYDPFAYLAYNVLKGGYSFVVKETAANILRYVAVNVNRFSAQRMVSDIKDVGVEPLLEDILDS